MAAIQDPAMGLIPKTRPKKYSTYQVASDASNKVFRFAPVALASGYIVPFAYDDTAILGVALHHVDDAPGAVTDIIVCDDADQVYEATFDAAVVRADIGSFAPMVTGASGTYDHSEALLDESEISAAAATKLFQIVGLVNTVGAAGTKALVKLAPTQIDLEVPLT